MPFFSVVIPTYNRAGTILRAVNSVIRQSFSDWELIVVDDGSTDETAGIISRLCPDLRVSIIRQENLGRSAARNKGILSAKGRFVCFLDSDDEYLPSHLDTLHDLIIKNNCASGFYKTLGETGSGKEFISQPLPGYSPGDNAINYLLKHAFFVPTVCINSEVLKRNSFNESLWLAEDSELWMRILASVPLFQSHEVTVRIHEHNHEIDAAGRARLNREYIRTFEHISRLEELKGKYNTRILDDIIRKRKKWLRADLAESGKYLQYIMNLIEGILLIR